MEIMSAGTSNDSCNSGNHVEMTNEMSTEHDCIEAISPKKALDQSCSSDEETHPNSPWSSFLEGDTRSIASNSSWGSAIYTDMKFTMVSNLVFLLGASVQTYTTIMDLKDAKEEALEDDDGWDDDGDYDDDDYDDDYVYTIADETWYVLYSLGPFLYFINSIIDVRWLITQTGSPFSWRFCPYCPSNDTSSRESENPNGQEPYQRIVEVVTGSTEGRDDDDSSSCSSMESSIRVSYTTDMAWMLVAVFFFGAGAIFEFYSTLLDDYWDDDEDWDDDSYLIEQEHQLKWYVSNYKINFIGMHLYLISGLIMLIAQRESYRSGFKIPCCRRLLSPCRETMDEDDTDKPSSNNPVESSNRLAQLLMFLGTVLFVCGTLLDCTIAYVSDPAIREDMDPSKRYLWDINEVTLSILDLISSLSWNVDAVLYICADILLYSLHKKGSKGRKWLFKKRRRCGCAGEDGESSIDEEFEIDPSIPMFPDLKSDDTVVKPLLRGTSMTNYSSL